MTAIQKRAVFAIVALAAIALGFPPRAAADTTSRPSVTATPSGMRPGPAFVIQRYQRAIDQLNLAEEPKYKVEGIMDLVNQQGLDLSQILASTPIQSRYQKLTAFGKQIHQELSAVLSADQMKELDQKLGPDLGLRPTGQNAPAGMLDAAQQALAKLDLSSDQRQQIKDLIASTRQKLTTIRTNAAGGNVQQGLEQARQDFRDKLKIILTPDQMQAFADARQQALPQLRGPNGQPNSSTDSKQPAAENKPADLQSTGPDAGSPVPSVQITEVNGRLFSPAQYKGHVMVLEFGSMSCPVFRAHALAMETLRSVEGGRAFFIIVYTREAFPAGDKDVERNKDEGVSVAQTTTREQRKAQALEAQRELRITIPMAVDSMDDAVSNAFGTFPNGTVVIGKDGNIAARQQWTNPDSLRQLIDDAANAPAPPGH